MTKIGVEVAQHRGSEWTFRQSPKWQPPELQEPRWSSPHRPPQMPPARNLATWFACYLCTHPTCASPISLSPPYPNSKQIHSNKISIAHSHLHEFVHLIKPRCTCKRVTTYEDIKVVSGWGLKAVGQAVEVTSGPPEGDGSGEHWPECQQQNGSQCPKLVPASAKKARWIRVILLRNNWRWRYNWWWSGRWYG